MIVGVTTLLLAINPRRSTTPFRVFRLDGIVAIAVTLVVFHVALADLHELSGPAAFADFMLHTGPRSSTSTRTAMPAPDR